jgi:hypothetical protein
MRIKSLLSAVFAGALLWILLALYVSQIVMM